MNYKELLELFVSKDDTREWLLQPFKQKDYYYATDAIVAVRLPVSIAKFDYKEQEKPKNIAELFEEQGTFKAEINIRKLDNQLKPNIIEETKEEKVKCYRCNGEGEAECEECGGIGTCCDCEGEGRYIANVKTGKVIPDIKTPFKIKGKVFQYRNLKKLVDAAEILGKKKAKMYFKEKQAIFEVGDIKILMMPVILEADVTKIKL